MKNIVIVDDNIDFATMLKEFMERFGKVKCITFSNPFDVIKYSLVHKDIIDIIISDYQMPQLDGFSMARRLIDHNGIEKRIIIMSGYTAEELKEICKKHMLEYKVEVVCKDDLSFFINLAK